MNYAEHLSHDRRLCILLILSDKLVAGTANEHVVHTALESMGHRRIAHDTIRADIRFLIDKGLLTDEWLGDLQVVKLTRRGLDAAEGRIEVEGVKKPSIIG